MALVNKAKSIMDYNRDKVDEMTLALLFLVSSRVGKGGRAWRGFDQQTLERLHQKGWIERPSPKELSLTLTPGGMQKAEELFERHFRH